MRKKDEQDLETAGLNLVSIQNSVSKGKISVVKNSIFVDDVHVAQFMKRDIKEEEVDANIKLWTLIYNFPLMMLMLQKEDYKVKYRATFFVMILFGALAAIGWTLFFLMFFWNRNV